MRAWISLATSLLCLSTPLGADEYRPAPVFKGKVIPDPPEQGKPWTPPDTKLPRFLKTATSLLFDQGVADPRGCEYREVEIGEGRIVNMHGWVLPERPGEPHRFVIGWNGVIYPAISVGAKVDLEADVRTPSPTTPESGGGRGRLRGTSGMNLSSGLSPRDPSRLKIVMFLRLGRSDLAESLFAAWTGWTRDRTGRDLTDYGMSYLTLAGEWAETMDSRLVSAHLQGDDVVALDAARRLSAFTRAAEAKADELGFQRPGPEYGRMGPGSYFQVTQLDELLADHERRAAMPPRTPIPKQGQRTLTC